MSTELEMSRTFLFIESIQSHHLDANNICKKKKRLLLRSPFFHLPQAHYNIILKKKHNYHSLSPSVTPSATPCVYFLPVSASACVCLYICFSLPPPPPLFCPYSSKTLISVAVNEVKAVHLSESPAMSCSGSDADDQEENGNGEKDRKLQRLDLDSRQVKRVFFYQQG